MPRLGRHGLAVSLASILAVASSRVAAKPPSAQEVAKRWSRQPARFEELRQRVRDRYGRELPGTLGRHRQALPTSAVAPGGLDAFHAPGLAVPELEPRNPLLDPLGIFEGEAGEEPPVPASVRLFLADFDGDGDLDAFVGDKYGYVRYLRNDAGPDGEPLYVELTGAASPTGALDLSRDGDGGAPFGPSAPTLVNIDGDGDLDLFVGQGYDDESPAAGARVLFFENVGGTLVRDDAGNPLAGFDFGLLGAAPHFVDIDQDGDLDAFVGNKLEALPPEVGEVRFLQNQGDDENPVFVDRSDVPGVDPFADVDFGPFTAPFFADIDGDGDDDAFIGQYYGVSFFENQTVLPGPPLFLSRTGYDPPLAGNLFLGGGPVVADVDGDGDLDAFVTGGYFKDDLGIVQYFENTGSSTDPAFLSTGDRLELVDVDGDGDLDALVSALAPYDESGYYGGAVWLFENAGTPAAPVWELRSGTANPFFTFNTSALYTYSYYLPSFAATVGHLDGDGLLDAFVGSYYGLEFLSDDGAGQLDPAATHPLEALDLGGDIDPQLVDVDGDGELDLVVGHTRFDEGTETTYSYVTFFLNALGPAGIDATPDLELDFSGLLDRPAPTVADIDGDGDGDLHVGGLGPGSATESILFLENTGGLGFDVSNAAPLPIATAPFVSPALGDLNGDGVLDLFLGSTKGVEMFFSEVASLEVTKQVSGGDLLSGGTVEYTVTIENVGTGVAADDPVARELVDVLPPELTLTGAMVVSGPGSASADLGTNTVTYDGAIAPGEVVTLLVTAGVGPGLDGQAIANQAVAGFDASGDGTLDSSEPSDDPATAADDDPTTFVVGPVPRIEVTKQITGGDLRAGGTVEYTVTIENVGVGGQPDDPDEPELVDVLPSGLTLVSAAVSAGPGAVTLDVPARTVRYDGAIPAGTTVSIVVTAAIAEGAEGMILENQAVAFYDADIDGDNETEEPSDDPASAAVDDPTAFVAGNAAVVAIPTLSQWGAALLAALLSLAGVIGLRRRVAPSLSPGPPPASRAAASRSARARRAR